MIEGIVIGVGVAVLSGFIIFIGNVLAKLWNTPKRLDRLERIIPTMARALLVLLQVHVYEKPDGEAEQALTELKAILTDGSVSQKAGK